MATVYRNTAHRTKPGGLVIASNAALLLFEILPQQLFDDFAEARRLSTVGYFRVIGKADVLETLRELARL